ncbi:MAG: phosphodiesterase [Erysipelotrichaceae bacterium]
MQYLVLSDIHGGINNLRVAIEYFKSNKLDKIIILGDILYHGPRNDLPMDYQPKEVINLLNQHKDKIIAVRGNCDAEVDQMVLEFNVSEDYKVINLKNLDVYISHGHIYYPENLISTMKKNDAFLFGHIHLPLTLFEDNHYILNPGSLTIPKEDNPASFALLNDNEFTIFDISKNILKQIYFN